MRGDGAGVCRVPGRAAYKKTPVTAGLTGVFSGLRRVQGHDGVFRANVLFFLRFVTVDTFDTFSRRRGVDGADGGKFAGSLRVMFGAAVAARDDRGDSAVSRGRAVAWEVGGGRGDVPRVVYRRFAGLADGCGRYEKRPRRWVPVSAGVFSIREGHGVIMARRWHGSAFFYGSLQTIHLIHFAAVRDGGKLAGAVRGGDSGWSAGCGDAVMR